MELSIIVPVFNIENYIVQCIESILAQSFSEFECILVDDGSQDGSGEICDLYAERDSRVKVIHKKNGGLVSARKAGFTAANGKYIAFVDGDDWIEPDMYKMLISEMKSSPDNDLVICGYYEDFHNRAVEKDGVSKALFTQPGNKKKNTSKLINEDFFFDFIYRPNMWGKLFLKEKLQRVLMNEDEQITMGEDVAVTFPYMLSCKNIEYVPNHLYHYRQRQSSMVHAYDEKLSSKIKILLKYMKKESSMKEFSIRNEMLLFSYYLVVFVFRNEALKSGFRDTYRGVKELYTDREFMNIVKQVRLPNAKLYHKLFYASLSVCVGGGYSDNSNSKGVATSLCSVVRRTVLKPDKSVAQGCYQQSVSVIIPLYYGKKYIDNLYQMITAALDRAGLLAESEIIFVNDSPDEIISLRECEHAALINNECNVGIHGSKCNGLKYAKGAYIHFLDQDDRISQNFYKSQLEKINDADIIVCNAILENAGYQRKLYRSKVSLNMVQKPKSYVYIDDRVESLGQCLIRKKAIPTEWLETIVTKNGADDYYLLLNMFVKNRSINVNDEVLYRHVYTSDNLSLNKAAMTESVKEVANLMQLYYPNSGLTRLLCRRVQYLEGRKSASLLPFMALDAIRQLSRRIRG